MYGFDLKRFMNDYKRFLTIDKNKYRINLLKLIESEMERVEGFFEARLLETSSTVKSLQWDNAELTRRMVSCQSGSRNSRRRVTTNVLIVTVSRETCCSY